MCKAAAEEKFVMDTLTKAECTAPAGQYRIAMRDNLDGCKESVAGDAPNLEEATRQAEVYRGPSITDGIYPCSVYVFNDKGVVVHQEG